MVSAVRFSKANQMVRKGILILILGVSLLSDAK